MWRSNSQQEAHLAFMIRGAGRESVNDLARISGTKSACTMSRSKSSLPLEPTYTIVDAGGKLVKQGNFEYG